MVDVKDKNEEEAKRQNVKEPPLVVSADLTDIKRISGATKIATQDLVTASSNEENENLTPEFEINLARLARDLRNIPQNHLGFGPKYTVTGRSKKVFVETVYSNYNHSDNTTCSLTYDWKKEDPNKWPGQVYVLLARDEKERILGTLAFSVNYDRYEDTLNVEGRIEVGIKGKGLATAIELANTHLLQLIANERQIKIRLIATNMNLERLKTLREKRKRGEIEQRVLDDAEIEQKRWLSLYGQGGKMGISMDNEMEGHKFFSPKRDALSKISDMEEITLTKETNAMDGTVNPKITAIKSITSTAGAHRKKLALLKETLLDIY